MSKLSLAQESEWFSLWRHSKHRTKCFFWGFALRWGKSLGRDWQNKKMHNTVYRQCVPVKINQPLSVFVYFSFSKVMYSVWYFTTNVTHIVHVFGQTCTVTPLFDGMLHVCLGVVVGQEEGGLGAIGTTVVVLLDLLQLLSQVFCQRLRPVWNNNWSHHINRLQVWVKKGKPDCCSYSSPYFLVRDCCRPVSNNHRSHHATFLQPRVSQWNGTGTTCSCRHFMTTSNLKQLLVVTAARKPSNEVRAPVGRVRPL